MPKRLAMVLTVLFTLGVGSVLGETYTLGWGTASGTKGTYTNFSRTSGTVDNIVSFTTAANSGSTPAYNSNNSELRLYYASNGSGGSITLTPAAGITITGVVMTTSTNPSVKYTVNGGTATSVSASNQVYTISGISATTSLKIQNVNTTNTQLRIKTIEITYTTGSGGSTGGDSGSDDDGDCVWTLVTDASTLKAGDEVVIAAKDYNYAISTTQNNNNRGQVAITKSNDKSTISEPSKTVQILTLETGKTSGSLAFNTGSGYLYAASSSSNYLRTETTLSNNSSWTISIANSIATITAQGSNTNKVMQYNQSSSLFACYASASQKALVIYKKDCSSSAPSTHTVKYDGNGATSGSAPTDANSPYTEKTSVTVLGNTGSLAKTGYAFKGWNTQADGQGTSYSAGGTFTITEDIILYAQWTAIQTIITLNANGGSGNTTSVAATYDSSTLNPSSITNPTKTGHTFGGWYSGEGGTGSLVINSSGKLQANVSGFTGTNGVWKATTNKTLYAKWTPAVYTITYKDQGGANFSGQHEAGYPQNHTYNTETTLKSASKEHYTFGGWYKEIDCSGTAVTTLGATEYTDEITLYAKWTAKTYTITFDAGTGECVTGSATTTNVGGVTLPTATHTCPDWTFAGWWTEEVSSTNTSPGTLLNAGDTYKPTSDITLYAVYSAQEAGDAFTKYAKVTTAPDDWSGKYLLSTGTYTATGALNSGHLVRTTYTPGTEEKADWEFTLTKVGNKGYSILFPDGSWYLGHYDGTKFGRSIDDPVDSDIAAYLWTPSTNGITNVSATSRKIADNGSTDFRPYSDPLSNIVYLYKRVGGGSTTIYNSNPTCLVPVWEGATIDKTNLTVNCGERSPMTGANGAAKITFPTEKIYNFTKDITIEATTGFLVSTSQSVDANYKSSVSLSPLVGTANANTFYEKPIYVRAEAPAQSDTDLEGTVTIKNNKGETLQTFSVTADVTCTQYTLTLVDRGVSTEQPTKYYAGETIDEAPADPEGVCTDPIHYVFDGWAEATVAEGSTTYTKVSFPYTVTGNTKFYAVYRYVSDGGEPSNDFIKVTKEKDDWTGDYVIVNEDAEKAIGNAYQSTNTLKAIDVTITDNKVVSPSNDIIWQIRKHGEYYTMYNASANKYAYIAKTDAKGAGLSATTTNTTQDIQIVFNNGTAKVSGVDIYRCFYYYGTNTEWRTYATGSYNTGALYCRSLESYLYTTSPICGPHLAITEGKDIYVTGGNAGGTRDLVIAQQKVSYKATRLNVGPTSQVPDVKVATNGITVGGVVTSDVKVAIDQTKEQQTDGTYTITGTITVQYQPSANNKQEDIQVQLAVDYNAEARDNFTVHARSLPSEFVIVAKSGDKWYALNGDMANGSSANPANGQVTLDNDANPTKATYAPCNTIYTLDGVPNTGDRTRVRFQGTDGAWLWAASGTNVGIQNKSLKEIPEGNNNAYNWKLETDDNITYKFHNDNNSRLLGLNGEKFGMYASGVQDIRILPYEAKCLYNYAPSNLKVSVLKGTYVTLTWDAVAGATKYQYSTNGTTWTDAGSEPTVTVNGLEGGNKYTYYIRAYHEDAGVSQECIDYAEITFTTANCDDVPTNITYTADLNSITVSWTAAAPTATIKLYLDENGEHAFFTQNGTTSPWRISTLSKNTTYYLQIFSDETCASAIIPVKTEDVEVDIVEWDPQGIIVDINTDETIGVTLENEVSYGSGLGTEATELFFSKYYEASYNVKLVAIYNGTKNIIDLTDYTIQYGKTSWETNYITLKDFGATKGQIQPGEEIILYSYTENNADDKKILDCVHDAFPDGNWVRVTSSNNEGEGSISFAGDKTIILCKTEYDDEADEYYDNIIDVIGALKEDPNEGILPTNENTEKPSWGDNKGWVCETGLSIADDSQIGISTNRCLLVRNNTVTSGLNAVAQNIEGDFVTLCSEWKGAQVPDSDIDNGVAASCENFAYVGTFDYSDYYTKYETMGDERVFDENARNADGTVTIPITDLYKHACSNIRVKLSNKDGEVLSDREYKVPIMITTTQGTDGQAFLDLQQNLATKEVDGEGNVINTYPLSLDEVREICKTCDVVVRDNATLTKIADDAANDHPQVRNVYVYENSSLIVPNGTNYTINNLSLRRKEDAVASVSTHPDALKLPESAAAPISLDFRLSAENWHWFTLPYDCNISEVTWADGTPAQYNTDWYLMTYDGKKRAETQAGGCWKAYTGTTINAGDGFIIAINGNINNPAHTYELRFPMSKEVLAAEGTDKTVAVRAWGVETNIRPNHKGWNLVGNPYLAYYQRNNITNFEGLRLGQLTGPDPQTGYWEQTGDVPYVVVPVGAGWIAYEQVLASETDLLPFTAYFVQVGNDGQHNSSDELSISFDHTKLQLSATPMPASIIQRATSETDVIEPVIVGVSLTNSLGESDKTSLVIDNQFTDEYEMNADFFKWFGDYYKYYTKPVVYSLGADNGKRAFNALSEDLATQPISLGMYAAQAGNYTFTLDRRSDLSKVQEVWLYDATQDKYTNLMQDSYTFNTAKTESAGRFFLSVKMAPKISTDINNVTDGTIWATTQDHTIFVNGLLSNAQLWIYDATGKLLHTDQTQYYQHTYQVPVSGTYFVRVQNTMQTQTIKVVVE